MPARRVKPSRPASGESAEQRGARRACEADMAQRVAGERLAAQHEEIADKAGEHGGHARGRERRAHEIVFKHPGVQ